VLDKGIGHIYIKPRRPRLNGRVERSDRVDAEEFYRLLNGVVIDDAEIFNEKLQGWSSSTTTLDLTELWTVKRLMRDCVRRPWMSRIRVSHTLTAPLGVIQRRRSSGVIYRDFYATDVAQRVLAHEIGHDVGLCHCGHDGAKNVIYTKADEAGLHLLD
jgi:hypothetical protein